MESKSNIQGLEESVGTGKTLTRTPEPLDPSNPRHSIRAVVVSLAGTKYIGDLVCGEFRDFIPASRYSWKDRLINYVLTNDVVALKGGVVVDEMKVPMPNPNNPGQVMINRMVNVSPLVHALDAENTIIYLRVSEVAFLEDMSPSDRDAHEKTLQDGYRMLLHARASRSNIATPGTTGMGAQPGPGRRH